MAYRLVTGRKQILIANTKKEARHLKRGGGRGTLPHPPPRSVRSAPDMDHRTAFGSSCLLAGDRASNVVSMDPCGLVNKRKL